MEIEIDIDKQTHRQEPRLPCTPEGAALYARTVSVPVAILGAFRGPLFFSMLSQWVLDSVPWQPALFNGLYEPS